MLARSDARFTLAAVMLISAVSSAGIALPYPILTPIFLIEAPTDLTSYLGINPKLLLGVALAFYPLGILVGNSFIGSLSDRYGRRQLLLMTLAGGGVGYLLSAYALLVESYPLFLASRLFVGICEGNVAIARAIAADMHPAVDRTRAISLVDAARYVGWSIGPLAGAYLMFFGAPGAFFLAGAVLLLSMVVTSFAVAESTAVPAPTGDSPWKAMWRENSFMLLGARGVTRLFWVYFLFHMGLGAYFEYYPAWLVEAFDFGSLGIACWTSAMTVVMILASGFAVPAVARRLGPTRAVLAAMWIFVLALALMPFSTQIGSLVLFGLVGAAFSVYNGIFMAYAIEQHGDSYGPGRLMGLMTSTMYLATMLIALAGGVILLFGSNWAIWLGSGLIAVATILFLPEHRDATLRKARTAFTTGESAVKEGA